MHSGLYGFRQPGRVCSGNQPEGIPAGTKPGQYAGLYIPCLLYTSPTIIVNHDHSETVQSLIQMISANRTFDVIACTDEEDDLKEAFYYNKALAGIVIPRCV